MSLASSTRMARAVLSDGCDWLLPASGGGEGSLDLTTSVSDPTRRFMFWNFHSLYSMGCLGGSDGEVMAVVEASACILCASCSCLACWIMLDKIVRASVSGGTFPFFDPIIGEEEGELLGL